MKSVVVDKVASVTQACALGQELRISSDITAEEGVESAYSLMSASRGVYGESVGEWTAVDALGFSKIAALPGMFYRRAGEHADAGKR